MILSFDCETTTHNKGSPFDLRNFLVCVSYATDTGESGACSPDDPKFLELWEKCHTIVGFNLKFDLQWARKIGLSWEGKRLYDTSLGFFILNRQEFPFPSLDQALHQAGLPQKSKVVEEEYWNKGIQTDQIPLDILYEYAERDARLTLQLYQYQMEELKGRSHQQNVLVRLGMQDLEVLLEMEWNGLKFDTQASLAKAEETREKIDSLVQVILGTIPDIPFNFASNPQLSALLYGGKIKVVKKVPSGFYKSGAKQGQVKYSNQVVEYVLPRKYKPIKGSETGTPGVWSVDEATLKKLEGKSALIEKILEIKGLQKLLNTYYAGIPLLASEQHFEEGFIHGRLHQVRAATGRLSSSSPNQQNLPKDAKKYFVSRYD